MKDKILANYLRSICQYSCHKSVDYVDCLVSVIGYCMKDDSCMDNLDLLFSKAGKDLNLEASMVRHSVNMCLSQICFQSNLEHIKEHILGGSEDRFISTDVFLRGMVSYLQLQQRLDQKQFSLKKGGQS